MSKYVTPPQIPDDLMRLVDPDSGFLCMTSHWRPDPQAPDPEMPGQKLAMSSYILALPTEACLCGSGKPFGACCRRQRLWRPICPDPDMQGYSLVTPQAATFHPVAGQVIREWLMADSRLRCVDQSLASSFWTYWGDPPVEDQYGILCFGDVELKQNHTLVVSAMSDERMRVLLDLLRELVGHSLGEPQISQDPVLAIDKRSSKMAAQSPLRRKRRRQ